jgi:hypothetical protein
MSDARSREDVLREDVARFEAELSRAWETNMPTWRMATLRASLRAARAELAALERKREREA